MDRKSFYDFLVFIGRFQPFHKGHEFVVQKALEYSRFVIILCGSAYQPRSLRNPWLIKEREQMLRSCFSPSENKQIIVAPLMDVLYNDELWVRNVQQTIGGIVTAYHHQPHLKPQIGLIGHAKDHSSYYLKLFPQWSSVKVDNYNDISSTPIRQTLFAKGKDLATRDLSMLPQAVKKFLGQFCHSSDFKNLCDESEFIRKYQKGWESSPYPPTFVTVDAVVVQSGHILLVERKAFPGKGQWALPGGFVRQEETLLQGCLRELREETKLKVPEPVLKGSILTQQVFDDPNRSSRGRTITHAFHIELKPDTKLPKVKGGDDARQAFWLPLSQLNPEQLYEDHYFIIQKLLGIL